MTRGNYLSVNSHSIFHTMKHQHEQLFSAWKIWTPHFPTEHQQQREKIIHRGRKLCDMIKDDGEIFSNTNNFHCVPLRRCDFSSWKFFSQFCRWMMSKEFSLLFHLSPSSPLRENKFHIKWHSKLRKIAPPQDSLRWGEKNFIFQGSTMEINNFLDRKIFSPFS